MKIARIVGLAAMAAMALTALLGVGSALAVETTLCKSAVDSPYCVSTDRYPAETSLTGSASNATFSTSLGDIKCTSSSFSVKTKAAAGEPLNVGVPSVSFSGCTTWGTKCTLKPYGTPSSASLSWADHRNGQLKTPGLAFEFNCNEFGLQCNLELASGLTLSGGLTAVLSAHAVPLTNKGGYFCPNASAFSADYTISSPSSLYVARAQAPPAPVTGLCKGLEQYCDPSNLYPSGTTLNGTSSNVVIDTHSGIGDIVCSGSSSLTLHTTANYGNPLPFNSTIGIVGCKTVAWGASSCTVTTYASKGGLSAVAGAPNRGAWKGEITMFLSCTSLGIYCTFASSTTPALTVYGGQYGSAPKAVMDYMTLSATKSCFFGGAINVTGTFTMPNEANPVWVTNVVY